eukprot:GDKJ01061608.1.p1 GENE.GDKJ01061608.1~~GDKJ01061608.1.p1  ORF type:complete len:883 (-),score=241.52 GDKJ01061608.1:174-2822(-)
MAIREILQNCLAPSNEIRASAELQLDQASESDFVQFLGLLSDVVADVECRADVRQFAAISIKNKISALKPVRNAALNAKWSALDESIRSTIRTNLLRGFESTEELARAGAAVVVSAVACIDLLNGQWADLHQVFSNVLNNAAVPNPTKEAVLKTVLYIGQNFENKVVPDSVGRMLVELSIIGLNVNDNKCACQSAMALANAIPLAAELFEDEQACTNLVNTIQASWSRIVDEEFRYSIFFCILPLVQYGYNTIAPHMNFFVNISLEAIAKKSKAAMPALAFWSELAVCEDELGADSRKLVENNMNNLCEPLFMAAIEGNTDLDEEEPYEEESLTGMALSTLKEFAKSVSNNDLLQCILTFFTNHNNNPQREFRDVAIYCFSLLCIQGRRQRLTKDTNFQSKVVEQLGRVITAAKTDASPAVRDTAVYAIYKCVEELPEIALNENCLKEIVSTLIDLLDRDCMRVVKQCAIALLAVHHALDQAQRLLIFIQPPQFRQIVETLYIVGNKAFRLQYPDIGTACYETLDEWIKSVDQPAVQGFADTLFKALQSYTSDEVISTTPVAVLEGVQDALLASIANLVHCLHSGFENIIGPCLELVMKIFHARTESRQPLPHAGIKLLEALMFKSKTAFQPYIHQVFPVLSFALQDADNHQACTAACSCLSILSMRFPQAVTPHVEELVRVVGPHFENPFIENMLRGEIIALMSNLVITLKGNEKVGTILPLVMAAIAKTAQYSVSEDSDEEVLRVADQMYDEVCEAYSRLVLSFPVELMSNYVAHSSTVLTQVAARCNQEVKPYSSHIICCITMIADLLAVFKEPYAHALVREFLPFFRTIVSAARSDQIPVHPSMHYDDVRASSVQVITRLRTEMNKYKNIFPPECFQI